VFCILPFTLFILLSCLYSGAQKARLYIWSNPHELIEILHICRPHSRYKSLCGNEKGNIQTFLFLLGATSSFERKRPPVIPTEGTERRSIDVIPAKAGIHLLKSVWIPACPGMMMNNGL